MATLCRGVPVKTARDICPAVFIESIAEIDLSIVLVVVLRFDIAVIVAGCDEGILVTAGNRVFNLCVVSICPENSYSLTSYKF